MHMSEDEDCDEDDLPSIIVNSSANNSSTFAMPSAEELAEQRAREREREQQLEQLRQRARDDERVAALRHSDSSGSEGELALAAAVTALSVRAPPPVPPARPAAAALWAALAPLLPPPAAALQQWLSGPAPPLGRAVEALAGSLAAEAGAWPLDEVLCAGALLSVALLAHESRCRRAAARAAHALLDDHATSEQVSALSDVLLAALPAARVRLTLSDALRSGAAAGADCVAAALTGAAMLQLLRAPPAPRGLQHVAHAAGAWAACDAAARATCVQLAGRLLAAAPGHAACARLLAHLGLPPAPAALAHHPDRLKALVGVSKLKLLFSAKNEDSRQPRPQPDSST
ncbi:hypothetical protein PYW07_010317 [Mythimna separata]|uniref:Uncharacterized protein n=1 Tax=Mythimna separata TaxID=271217 RepID=A0AAD8DRG8_MYTSE|nr:hypothetical protein PYW07_010317 [Mythimna separata]